ncbi:MAG: hypothetical protein ACPGVG_00385 [Mycobacterium sp.]
MARDRAHAVALARERREAPSWHYDGEEDNEFVARGFDGAVTVPDANAHVVLLEDGAIVAPQSTSVAARMDALRARLQDNLGPTPLSP